MLWTCSSSLRFFEDSNCLSLIIIYQDDMLLIGRGTENAPIAGTRVCNKSKEVGADPLTGDRVSGYGNKLH